MRSPLRLMGRHRSSCRLYENKGKKFRIVIWVLIAFCANHKRVQGHSCWEYALEVIIEMIVLPCIHDIL
jgi:hypothetical protein